MLQLFQLPQQLSRLPDQHLTSLNGLSAFLKQPAGGFHGGVLHGCLLKPARRHLIVFGVHDPLVVLSPFGTSYSRFVGGGFGVGQRLTEHFDAAKAMMSSPGPKLLIPQDSGILNRLPPTAGV